ncbi:GPGG-motif small membrane protein [Marinitenerispora sediminis]|nr:GPGG-motif small membrane protein [Marinitenerispora sediminis]
MGVLLLILGVVLIVAGVLALLRRQMLWGIVLIVVGLIIAPSNFYIGA